MEREYIKPEQIIPTKCSTDEQQCIISWERLHDTVVILCSDNTALTRIKRQALKNPSCYKCWIESKDRDGRPVEYGFELPSKRLISFRVPKTKKNKNLVDNAEEQ